MVTIGDFNKIDLRIGTIIVAEYFEKAVKPAYKLQIDFGDIGILKSSAQITKNYNPKELINLQVIAVVNFPVKQIANFLSECLVLGVVEQDSGVTLLKPAHQVPNGSIIF